MACAPNPRGVHETYSTTRGFCHRCNASDQMFGGPLVFARWAVGGLSTQSMRACPYTLLVAEHTKHVGYASCPNKLLVAEQTKHVGYDSCPNTVLVAEQSMWVTPLLPTHFGS